MKHLFSPEGDAAPARLSTNRPLLAFDFDGTLSPIVGRPDDARVPLAVARRLERLGRPLAIAVHLRTRNGRRARGLVTPRATTRSTA